MKLFSDTGSSFTIIPPEKYSSSMGKVVASDTRLRAWGARSTLDVKGMVNTVLETKSGARKSTKVYIVAGYQAEPLLGDTNAEDLGFIVFKPGGRDPTEEERKAIKNAKRISIP